MRNFGPLQGSLFRKFRDLIMGVCVQSAPGVTKRNKVKFEGSCGKSPVND